VKTFDIFMEYVESGGTSIRTMSEESCDPISFFSLAEKFELASLQNSSWTPKFDTIKILARLLHHNSHDEHTKKLVKEA
jgi:hypothetical protein